MPAMLTRSIAFVIAICAVVAFFIPSASDEATQESSPHSDVMHVKIDPAARQPQTNWYSGDHILDRASDGHFYAEAYVSGTPVRMMVDTGASVIALTGSDANAVDGVEIGQVVFFVRREAVDDCVIFRDGGIVEGDEVGGESTDCGLVPFEVDAFVVGD